MQYLYIEKTRQGYRIRRDCGSSREGMHYVMYTKENAIKQFRRDFDCIGKKFIRIEI